MRVISSTNDLIIIKAATHATDPRYKDIGKILFPYSKDTSGKIHKDTSRKILLLGESPALF